ncbi:MAG TPA: pyridoxal 5'-phosphate synthase glutaminase subunit PdxT [Spirochaetota bacterium]|nr:pyridoxal 5'-phosphate synthase glutaminase subunit PdxT [Spirochaetota bacterium]
MSDAKKIGVLAMQGAFHKHCEMIERLGHFSCQVRTSEDLLTCDALIIPGGESTVMSKLITRNDLLDIIIHRAKNGMPIFGTCAGLILLASNVVAFELPLLRLLDVTVERNAYGRQLESFEANLEIKGMIEPLRGIFIRAPKIIHFSDEVEVLAAFDGDPVLVRQGNILGATFHPELTDDTRIHEFFLSMLAQ